MGNNLLKHIVFAAATYAQIFSPSPLEAPAIFPSGLVRYEQPSPVITQSPLEGEMRESALKFKGYLEDRFRIQNYITSDFRKDGDEILLARMIEGEAEDCSEIEKIAVAFTVFNRLKRGGFGATLKEVILHANQYSCFNDGTDSSIFLKTPLQHNAEDFFDSLKVAEKMMNGEFKTDPTHGATHYYNPDRAEKPYWAKIFHFDGRIGHHLFYTEV